MALVQVNFSDGTLSMIEEISVALEAAEGQRPTRTHVLRLAVAGMRKRMADEGLISTAERIHD
jgi:NaMN:DMB phosphoribosyltransferase